MTPSETIPVKPNLLQRCWAGLKGLAWLTVWIPEMLIALVVASVVALWIWAATPHSLPYVLQWAQSYTAEHAKDTGKLVLTDVQGSLYQGGKIGSLVWEKEGLRVQADGVDMVWSASMWGQLVLGRGIAIHQIHASRVVVTDTRATRPPDPLTQLPLPFAVSLGFSVDTLELAAQAVSVTQIKGLYAYAALDGKHWEHLLKMDSVQFAQGNYQGQLRVGDLSPMRHQTQPKPDATNGEGPAQQLGCFHPVAQSARHSPEWHGKRSTRRRQLARASRFDQPLGRTLG